MVYGELGRHPLSVTIKSRMLCFWFKLIQEDRKNKYCSVMYKLMYNLHPSLGYSLWLKYIKCILDNVGYQMYGSPKAQMYSMNDSRLVLRDVYLINLCNHGI